MITKKEFTINLPHTGGLEAVIILSPSGQEPPNKGDSVMVTGKIRLPQPKSESRLAYPLSFGERVKVAGQHLSSDWGCQMTVWGDKTYRERSSCFKSELWQAAFQAAEEWAMAEVQKLVDALETRYQALLDANPYSENQKFAALNCPYCGERMRP